MKKLLVVLLTLALLMPICASAIDNSFVKDLNYSELEELYEAVSHRIVEVGGFKSLKIPKGVYTIGVDIPQGSYLIKPEVEGDFYQTLIGVYDEDLQPVYVLSGLYYTNPYINGNGTDREIKLDLKSGYTLELGLESTMRIWRGFSFIFD